MSEEKLGQHYLAALNEAFPGVVLDHAWQTKDQLTVTVKVNYLPEVVEFLYYKQGGWLSVLFGNDERKLNGHYAVYYVLSMEKGTKCWVTVRVEVDANKPEYPSVTPRVPAAVWGEREVRDMYGLIPVGLPDERRLVLPDEVDANKPEYPSVTPRVPAAVWGEREVRDMYGLIPVGLPDERRLVLPDDWPDELYPLRKDSMDYRQRPAPTTDAETYEFINELGDKKNNVVPIGPLHVTSDEPGHFRLFRLVCRMNAVWCCRMTGRMNFILCVKTAWIIVSVRHRLPMLKPTSSSTNWATRKTTSCRLVHCTSLLTNRVTSVCSSMVKTLSTPTTACSTSIAAWKNWRKPVWVTTK